jgi:dTDP-4-amino-4,6-dideoxygalactose transaminase
MRPGVFGCTLFPVLWASSFRSSATPIVWEKHQRLDPRAPGYGERFSNVQARFGIEGLEHLDGWTGRTQRHAAMVTEALAGVPGVELPVPPTGRTHVYYQYCCYVADRNRLVKDCIRKGVDVEMRHVDVCTHLALFGEHVTPPGTARVPTAVQIPVYASLDEADMTRVVDVVRTCADRQRPPAAAPPV